jgi:hypothetical protein
MRYYVDPMASSRKMPSERERQLIAVRPLARPSNECTSGSREGKTRRKSKKRRGSRPQAAAKESHAYAQGNATPRKAGERTCSSRDRERGGIGDQRESCLDVGRPVGGDRQTGDRA